ncbi:uncharacterized protein LOC131935277 [Physella acuta]|uniref:uncharacterized protein LOC131935277 n=1 Tax=Physella acuta TaxID=109671 RepID=UPI0027DB5E0A|nr:uncharacterized protein LOC131935277 [Physella acuta]
MNKGVIMIMGTWVIPLQAPALATDGVIMSTGKYCDANLGYYVVTNVNTTVCIWMSTDKLQYTDARTACAGKKGYLYSGKNEDDLRMFLDIVTGYYDTVWYGLNELANEGTYVFDDDATILNRSQYKDFFYPGTWVIPLKAPSLATDGVIMSTGKYCDANLGYYVVTNVNTTVCIWMSTDKLQYTDARTACAGKKGYLYSGKNKDDVRIFVDIVTGHYDTVWYGLNELANEGTYVFDDDGSVLNRSLYKDFFCPGEPNNAIPEENCAIFYTGYSPLSDYACNRPANYMCQYNGQSP